MNDHVAFTTSQSLLGTRKKRKVPYFERKRRERSMMANKKIEESRMNRGEKQ